MFPKVFLYLQPKKANALKLITIKNKNIMKKVFFLALVIGVYSCAPCDEPATAKVNVNVNMPPASGTLVTLHFAEPQFVMEPMSSETRSALSTVSTKLDLWLTDGTTTTDIHQTSSDSGFGTVNVTLDKTKTYTLYAVAHKGDAAATLSEGIISFTDDKVKDTFWYTTTFSPSSTNVLNIVMNRIVSLFRLETTDAIPTTSKKMRITQYSVYDRWNVSTGATNQLDRVSTISISSTNADGTAAFNVYSINSDTETLHTITAEALDADDKPIQTKVFTDVPMRNNYKTTCRGSFFTDAAMSLTFTATDWNDYETINF